MEDPFDAVLDSQVTNQSLPERDAEAAGELIERLDDNGRNTGLIAIAPHGGAIEVHTDHQAEHVASRLATEGVSSWLQGLEAWRRSVRALAHHLHRHQPRELPRLKSVIGRGFRHAVAFHGFDQPEILIGGCADPSLKEEVKEAIGEVMTGSGIRR